MPESTDDQPPRVRRAAQVFLALPRAQLARIVAGGIVLQLLALAVPVSVHLVFDQVIGRRNQDALDAIALGMLLAAAFEALLLSLFSLQVHRLFERLAVDMAAPTLRHLLRLPLGYFDTHAKGEIARCVRDVADIRNFISAASMTTLTDILFILVILVLMAFYSPRLALTVALCIPILVGFSFLMGPRVNEANRRQAALHSRFEAVLAEGLNAIQTTKTHGFEARWQQRLQEAYDRVVQAIVQVKLRGTLEMAVSRLIQRVLMLAVLWIGAGQVLARQLSYGQLIVCYMLSLVLLATCGKIFEIWSRFRAVQDAHGSLDAMLAMPEEQEMAPGAAALPAPGSLTVQGLTYRYREGGPAVLKDVSFRIECPSFVGITGESGSGKSTLARLLQRHGEPQQGAILLGGADLRQIDLAALRRHVLLVAQDAALFHDTVAANLRWGAPGAPMEEVARAAALACADEFVRALPAGYDTVLAEGGAGLSSGQRQRLVLARAILQQPQVLVLDEALNALDAHTEETVLRNLRREFAERILVVVSHRPATLRDADRIVVVHRGEARVREPGLHPVA